ncbi:hypothetical protein LJY25_03515 [Hymenobacter sp. BT175]|uniref:hypothetical protein n=1 Tax=Hymenobacter translucens TaxID=2886507 RepID=UPI001D0E2254|nr:hypothetical protein [Hymenobacter translucens]MCC2545499.1 hypothetical protein [Hymenobacter translucens]
MVEAQVFLRAAKTYFAFLVSEFAFAELSETVRSVVFYELQYRNAAQVVSISFENLEDYLQITVFQLVNQQLPDYNDSHHTYHLHTLNHALSKLVGPDDWQENQRFFEEFKPEGTVERRLLKAAKELRVCLTHFDRLTAA